MADYSIFSFINNLAGNNITLDKFFVFISIAGFFIIVVLLLLQKDKRLVLKGLIVMALVAVLDVIINFMFYIPRPFVSHEVNLLVQHDSDSSFPSGHALRSFSLAQLLFLHNKKIGTIAYVIAVLVGFSRIFVGVHYPSDVLGGTLIGIGSAFAVNYFYERLVKG